MPRQSSSYDPGRLASHRLVRDFGPRRGLAREGVRALYDRLVACPSAEILSALEQWRAEAWREGGDARTLGTDALARVYGASGASYRPDRLTFAVQTYFALVARLIVGEVAAPRRQWLPPSVASALPNASRRLLQWLRSSELDDVFEDRFFSWYTATWDSPVEQLVRRMAEALARGGHAPHAVGDGTRRVPASAGDLFKPLYEAVFPRRLRHAAGEYYTPEWLVREMFDELGYRGQPEWRLLDPACGSGAFLVEAVRRLRAHSEESGGSLPPEALYRAALENVAGFDVNPLAVLTARANWLIAMADLLPPAGKIEVPIFRRDAILDDAPAGPFDCVVGNPPWIAWDDLPREYREATAPLWRRYGLFSLSAAEARHGGGKKDLSTLVAYVAADRYLKDGGRLAMVVTQTPFQTKGAGDGFRRFRLGDEGASLKVLRVNDLVALRPFDAANWTATLLMEKGSPTVYPVSYVKWLPAEGDSELPAQAVDLDGPRSQRQCYHAWPIDPQRPTSPWLIWPQGQDPGDGRHPLAAQIGPSDYEAHLGANTGGANGVYWLETLWDKFSTGLVPVRNVPGRGKRSVPEVEAAIEQELLYPLLRWGDVGRFHAAPKLHVLLVQDIRTRRGIDEATMRLRYPHAYAYLDRFRGMLSRRAAYRRYQERGPFYSMYDVGPYTFAPIKVVWRRMDRRINAAVVEEIDDPRFGPRPVVPQETCVLIAAGLEEAHYLCAILNSAAIGAIVAAHSVCGGKSFGTPGMLAYLGLRRFDPADPRHATMASLSRQAHAQAARGEDLAEIQEQIDQAVGRVAGQAKNGDCE